MRLSDPIEVLIRIAELFEGLGIAYLVGGSVASSIYSIPRMTEDVDVVAAIRPEHALPICQALNGDFYVDDQMIRGAIEHETSFNLIYLETMDRVDVFIARQDAWSKEQMRRRRRIPITRSSQSRTLFFASPEDTIIAKLDWYRAGGGVSDRQWRDIQAVLKAQQASLDVQYLHTWASNLGLSDLLLHALEDAGLPDA